ncbi:MAG: FecR domain-containing protein [Rhodocyclaceae bacterium]|nr:FecR domain-containing protein [Rhodocyclaceae bacterium]
MSAPATAGASLPDGVVDAAIRWSVKIDFNRAAPETLAAFQQWLAADPLHRQAWERVGSLRGDFAKLPSRLAMSTLQAVDSRRRTDGAGRRQAMKLLSLAGIALFAGWTARDHAPWQRLVADASTATGEQKTLRLADGTVVVLNTDSAVSADLAGERRLITLHRGEIMIATGPDDEAAARRPFWVRTPFGAMQALGTRFVVRLDDGRARVSVQEGAVELHPASGNGGAIVRAGESRWLADNGSEIAETHGFAEGAWVDGVISAQDMRLGDLIAELARYRSGRLGCDPRVADLPVSGTFHLRNTEQALHFLAQTLPIRLTYRTRYWVNVGPAADG